LAAWQLSPLTFILLPGAYLVLIGYSFTKRFTWMSHFILGFTDGLAPVGAWAAIRNSLFTAQDIPAWILLGVVTFWIAGFDMIYACQDVEFDRQEGLQSIPARFGIPAALRFSSICHVITIGLLVGLGAVSSLDWPYWIGLLVVAGLLVWEHRLVQPDDLSKLGVAFFNINGYISITLFIAILGSLYIT
jgi:4-hydroxybenzoate polyprenyltransferase